MPDENPYKEVYFSDYCHKCKHILVDSGEDPCDECLSNSVNLSSHIPVKYEER